MVAPLLLLAACVPPGVGTLSVVVLWDNLTTPDGSSFQVSARDPDGIQVLQVSGVYPQGEHFHPEPAVFEVSSGQVEVEATGEWWYDAWPQDGGRYTCQGGGDVKAWPDVQTDLEVEVECEEGL